jgi:hypothetical protein
MRIGQRHKERIRFAITSISGHDIFIGYDWLMQHNPDVNWKEGILSMTRCPKGCYEGKEIEQVEYQHKVQIRRQLIQEAMIPIWDIRNVSMDIKIKEFNKMEKKPWKEWIPQDYHRFETVFEKTEFDQLPERRPWDHAIDFKEGVDVEKLKGRPYALSPKEMKALDDFLDENIASGRIRPSISPIASPFFFVSKKTGDLRPTQDYRNVNTATIKNRYPLPFIQTLVDKLKAARWFSKADVRWGYNNIRIKEGDEWKAAFITPHRGLFEPTVMFFGLCNSPATFQAFMDHIFEELVREGKVIVYMDDILVFTETLEEQHQIMARVL